MIDASVHYCTFQLGHLAIGVEVQRVQEVIRHERIARGCRSPRR